MRSTSAVPPTPSSGGSYPPIDESTAQAIERHLVEAVSLAHGGALSSLQLKEFTLSLTAQSRAIEALHRVRLTNADEPAFTITALQGDGL